MKGNLKMKEKPSFFDGLMSPYKAWAFMRKNGGFKRYLVLPVIFNLILLIAIIYVLYYYAEPRLASLISGDQWYLYILRKIAGPVFYLLMAVLGVILFVFLSGILSAPANDMLTARIETLCGLDDVGKGISIFRMVADVLRMTSHVIKFLIAVALAHLITLFFHLLPGIGTVVYGMVNYLITAYFLAFQFFDFPLDRRRFSFRAKLHYVWSRKAAAAGLGAGIMLISFIPLVNLLSPVLGAAAATCMFCNFKK